MKTIELREKYKKYLIPIDIDRPNDDLMPQSQSCFYSSPKSDRGYKLFRKLEETLGKVSVLDEFENRIKTMKIPFYCFCHGIDQGVDPARNKNKKGPPSCQKKEPLLDITSSSNLPQEHCQAATLSQSGENQPSIKPQLKVMQGVQQNMMGGENPTNSINPVQNPIPTGNLILVPPLGPSTSAVRALETNALTGITISATPETSNFGTPKMSTSTQNFGPYGTPILPETGTPCLAPVQIATIFVTQAGTSTLQDFALPLTSNGCPIGAQILGPVSALTIADGGSTTG